MRGTRNHGISGICQIAVYLTTQSLTTDKIDWELLNSHNFAQPTIIRLQHVLLLRLLSSSLSRLSLKGAVLQSKDSSVFQGNRRCGKKAWRLVFQRCLGFSQTSNKCYRFFRLLCSLFLFLSRSFCGANTPRKTGTRSIGTRRDRRPRGELLPNSFSFKPLLLALDGKGNCKQCTISYINNERVFYLSFWRKCSRQSVFFFSVCFPAI